MNFLSYLCLNNFPAVIKRILVVLGLASVISGLSYYLFTEYKIVNSWQFTVVGLKLLNYGSEYTSVNVSLKIVNVSSIEARISKLNANVYVSTQGATGGAQYIGTLSQPDVMSIPAQGYNVLSLDVTIQNSSFLQTLLNFTSTGNPINLEVVGTVLISSGFLSLTVPFDETSTYTLADIIS